MCEESQTIKHILDAESSRLRTHLDHACLSAEDALMRACMNKLEERALSWFDAIAVETEYRDLQDPASRAPLIEDSTNGLAGVGEHLFQDIGSIPTAFKEHPG